MRKLRTQGSGLREKGLTQHFALALLLSLSFALCVLNWSHAAFENTDTGARAAALGGAYVAVGDDASSLMYNPAGLARVHQEEIATEYSRFYSGLTDGSNLGQYFLGYAYPLKHEGAIAVGWKQLSLDDLYTERTLSLGYGRWITPHLAVGAAFKQLYHSFGTPSVSVDDAGNIQPGAPAIFAQNGTSKSAFTGDMGLLYRFRPHYLLGFSVQNLNSPNVALSSSDEDRVPPTARLGLAYQKSSGLSLTTALTTSENVPGERDYKGIGAVEKWWSVKSAGDWAARGAFTLGNEDVRQFSVGFGWRLSSLMMDYAFVFDLSGITPGETLGTHRFSLSYRFSSPAQSKRAKNLKAARRTMPVIESPNEGTTGAFLSISTNSVEGLMPFTLDVSSSALPSPPTRRLP